MQYTEEFKARCKKAYPDWEKLHEELDAGSVWVGHCLNDGRKTGIDYAEILSATSLEDLKAKALLIKEQNDLYHDFANGNCFVADTRLDDKIWAAQIISKQNTKLAKDLNWPELI